MTAQAPEKTPRKARVPKAPKVPKPPKAPNPCLGAVLERRSYPCTWYGVHLPFKPSNKQLRGYAEFKRHRLVLNYQVSPPAATFDDAALTKLQNRYPKDRLYPLVATHRELEKCHGTYVEGMAPGADHRIHEEFSHRPKTLRLAARWLMTLPRPDKPDPDNVYNRVRRMIMAAPGHVLLARDFSGLEAVTTFYLANDPKGLRLARSIADVHGFIASHAVGQPADLSWSDQDLIEFFSTLSSENREWQTPSGITAPYKTIRTACKRGFFLSIYGGSAHRMIQAEPDLFPTLEIASWYQRLIFDTFPSLRAWQWATCQEAERQGFFTSPSGLRLENYNVFDYVFNEETRRWDKTLGENAKEAIAAGPQHLGMMFAAAALARADADPVLEPTLRMPIHDEIMTEVAEDQLALASERLRLAMEAPLECCPLPPAWGLGPFLTVATEAKTGPNWAQMTKLKEGQHP